MGQRKNDDPRLAAFGARVRELRLARGWSQEQLASATGLHSTYVGSLERGERNVGLINVHVVAKGLGVRVTALFPD